MSTYLKKSTRLRKTLSVVTSIATIAVLSGVLVVAPNWAQAVKPADYGLTEGDFIRAEGDIDVFIVNDFGYKRLILSPEICKQYGHLGRRGCFDVVKVVSSSTRDAFSTSWYYTNGETKDGKVYALVTTGEDTADLHHMNVSGSEFTSQGGIFQSVFLYNTLEQNTYSTGSTLTQISDIPAQYVKSVTPSGPLSVAYAPGNPSAATVTINAQGVEMLKARFSGSGTVNSVTVKRVGAGKTADFSNVYLYEGAQRLVSGKSLSTSTGEATFSNLDWEVSGTRDLSVVGDFSSATAGDVNALNLTVVSASGTVSGLPLNGNNFAVSGASSGTLTVTKSGSIANPNVGARDVRISEFKVTAGGSEAISIKRIQLLQNESVKPSDISDLKLKTGTSEWSGTINSAGEVVFDLGTGFSIAKGGNKIFKVYADVDGKKGEKIELLFETATDILGIGDQFGFGVAAVVTSFDTGGTDPHLLTLQGGVLTLTFVGPNAADVGTDTNDTVFLSYTMSAATDVEIRKTRLSISLDTSADGWDDVTAANGVADLDDIKIINTDTGAVIVGPLDGDSFETDDTDGNPDSGSSWQRIFTDVFDIAEGETLNLAVTADIKTANTRTGTDFTSADLLQMHVQSYHENVGLTEMKYSGTNTALAAADIVPNGDIRGRTMTVNASALTLGLASFPVNDSHVKGTSNVDAVGITFKAAQASDLKVTDITLTGYKGADGTTFTIGALGELISSVALYDGGTDTLISNTPSSNNLGAAAGTVAFNDLNWNILAGETKTLAVRVDLSTNEPAATKDFFAFDIVATTDVTALDSSDSTVNGTATPNSSTTPTVDVQVTAAGSLAVAAAPGTPTLKSLYWGQTPANSSDAEAEVSRFRFTATNEAFYLETLTFEPATAEVTDFKANVKKVHVSYKNEAGSTLTRIVFPDSNGSVSLGFSGTNRPYVPKDSSTDISLMYEMKTRTEGATGDVAFSLDFDGGDTPTTDFKAIGAGSGTTLTAASSGIEDATGNDMRVYRVFPKFTNNSTSSGGNAIGGNKEVIRFTITAVGLPDSKLYFDGGVNAASGSILFDTVASGQTNSAMTLTFYGADDNLVYGTDAIDTAQSGTDFVASLSFGSYGGTGRDLEIAGGASKTIYATTTFVNFATNGDHFQLVLRDESAAVKWVANSDVNDAGTSSTANALQLLPISGTSFVTTGL